MQITLGNSALLLIASAMAAAAISFWIYRHTTPRLSLTRRTVLASLRFLSLTIILFLLARPILARLLESHEPPILAVLVDSSQSVGVSGAARDSTSAARVHELASAIVRQDIFGEVHLLSFDSGVRRVANDSANSIRFDGQRTDIASAIEWVEDNYSDANLGGVLLVSDGRYNAGRSPVHVAEKSPVPIFTITVGDSTERQDVRITGLNTNELTYSGVEVPVRVNVSATGFAGRRATVSLTTGGTVLGTVAVDLPPDRVDGTVELSFLPDSPGLYSIQARVSPLEGELTTRNNVASTAIRVLDSRRKVLLVGAAPDPDVSALYQTLSAGNETEVTRLVQKSGQVFYGGSFPNDLSVFDAIVLVGYPGTGAGPADLGSVAAAAASGTPVLFTLTRGTDLRLFRQHIAPIVGVDYASTRRGFFEAATIVTPAGRRHPVFEGLGPDGVLAKLPPMTYNESNWSASPDATVLATIRVRGIDLSEPAIVTRKIGPYRAAAILGGGSWRLTNLPEDLSQYDEYWPTVVNNLVRWLSATRDDRPVRVRTTRDQFAGDEPIEFVGQVYDESLNPVNDANVEVLVTSPGGNEFRHVMKPVGSGRYALELPPSGEGAYSFAARGYRDDVAIGEDSGSFAVGNLSLEFRNTSADPELMRQIAYRSGGRQLGADSAENLPDILRQEPSFVVQSAVVRYEVELWRQFIFAGLVIALLTTEWILRKRSGLS